MGLAACTTLISSLSLKQTDWPLYLHEPNTGGTAHLEPANIWLHGPSHTALVTLANQRPVQGAPAAEPVYCLHIHLSRHPTGFFFSSDSVVFFPSLFPVRIATFSIHLLWSPLFVWPSVTSRSPPRARFFYPGNEDGEQAAGGGGAAAGGAGSGGGERGINLPLCHPAS